MMARRATAPRCCVGNGRVAIQRGNMGAGLPTIIWNAGTTSNSPPIKEIPGVAATTDSISIIKPNDCLCRLPVSHSRVTCPAGASSYNSCKIAEARTNGFASGWLCVNAGFQISGPWRLAWDTLRDRKIGSERSKPVTTVRIIRHGNAAGNPGVSADPKSRCRRLLDARFRGRGS
jgi:hypothetical protein